MMRTLNKSNERACMRLLKVIVSLAVTITIMIVIFMLSAQSGSESGTLSSAIARMLANIFIADFNELNLAEQASIIADWSWPVRKTAHATEYGCLAVSCFISCWQLWLLYRERRGAADVERNAGLSIALISFVITVIYACTDELHQLFIDGRAGQVADVLVDASGALIGCVLCYAIMCIAAHISRSR